MPEGPINTDALLLKEMGKQAAGQSGMMNVTPSLISGTAEGTQIGDVSLPEGDDGGIDPQVTAATASTDNLSVEIDGPSENLGQIDKIDKVQDKLADATLDPAQITKDIKVQYEEGKLSSGAIAKAETIEGEEFDTRATVKHQLADLLSGIEEGKPLPPWASPAARKVAGMMQARGLGSSSMASAAMIQSIMESGIPIAAKDAEQYAKVQLANLNRQRTALQNAAAQAL